MCSADTPLMLLDTAYSRSTFRTAHTDAALEHSVFRESSSAGSELTRFSFEFRDSM